MAQDTERQASSGAARRQNLLKVTLLAGGATLLFAGALCYRLRPSNRAKRMLDRAQRKMEEAEAVLAEMAE